MKTINNYHDDQFCYNIYKIQQLSELSANFSRNGVIFCNFTNRYSKIFEKFNFILPESNFYLDQICFISQIGLSLNNEKNEKLLKQIKQNKHQQINSMIQLAQKLLKSFMYTGNKSIYQIKPSDCQIFVFKKQFQFEIKFSLNKKTLIKLLQDQIFIYPPNFYSLDQNNINTKVQESHTKMELNNLYRSLQNKNNSPPYYIHQKISKIKHREYQYYDQLYDQLSITNYFNKIQSWILQKCGCQHVECNQCKLFSLFEFSMLNETNPFTQPIYYNLKTNRFSLALRRENKIQYYFNNYWHFRQNITKQCCSRIRKQFQLSVFPNEEIFSLFFQWNKQHVLIKDAVRGKQCNHIAYQQLFQLYQTSEKKREHEYLCKICSKLIKQSDILYLSQVDSLQRRLKKMQKQCAKKNQQILDAFLIINHKKKKVTLRIKYKYAGETKLDKSDIYDTLIDPLYIYNEFDMLIDSDEEEQTKHFNWPEITHPVEDLNIKKRIHKIQSIYEFRETECPDIILVSIIKCEEINKNQSSSRQTKTFEQNNSIYNNESVENQIKKMVKESIYKMNYIQTQLHQTIDHQIEEYRKNQNPMSIIKEQVSIKSIEIDQKQSIISIISENQKRKSKKSTWAE